MGIMLDLFTPQVPVEALHKNFRAIVEYHPEALALLSEWQRGFVDRDGKFVKEFQTTFNPCFWELYLHACFKELGHEVDFTHARPDFLLRDGVFRLCTVEATTANHAEGARPEWEQRGFADWEEMDIEQIVNEATIRIANSLTAKHRLYKESYESLPHVQGVPFVIALAPFVGPIGFMQGAQAVRRVLYGYDHTVVEDRGGIRVVAGHQFMKTIQKPNGTTLPLAYFLNDHMKDVSAVVFSNVATFGKVRALSARPDEDVVFATTRFDSSGMFPRHEEIPLSRYNETLLDGLKVFHNPNATHPLPRNIFAALGVAQFSCNLTTGVPVTYDLENHLDTRATFTQRRR